jgi:hypothetical protein
MTIMIVTTKEMLLFLFCILTLSGQCQAISKSSIKSIDQDSPLVRLILVSFELELSPTVSALTMSDESLLHKEAEKAVRVYLAERRGQAFEYALLADIEDNIFEPGASRRNEMTTGSTTLRFKGGVAAFRSTEGLLVPSATELNGWIEVALEQNLLAGLAATSLQNITNSTYTPLADPPTQSPSQSPSQVPSQSTTSYKQVSSVVESNTSTTTSDHGTVLKVGILVGILAFVGVVLAAFFVIHKRRSDTTSVTTATPNPVETVDDKNINQTNDVELSVPQEDDPANTTDVWNYLNYFTTCSK